MGPKPIWLVLYKKGKWTDRYEWKEDDGKRHREEITTYNLRRSDKTGILINKESVDTEMGQRGIWCEAINKPRTETRSRSPLTVPSRNPSPPTFQSWAPGLENWKTVSFCCLSQPFCDILLWQPSKLIQSAMTSLHK